MPSRAEHIAKARTNEVVAEELQAGHPDWALTALFYAAVHWVDAVLDGLDGMSVHPRSHTQRDRQVVSRPSLAAIERDYFALKDMSVAARYTAQSFSPENVAHYRRVRFEPVRAACRLLLGLS